MATATERMRNMILATTTVKPKVALDTCCVQYFLDDVKPWSDVLEPFFRKALDGQIDLYISTVTVSELFAKAYFDFNRNTTPYDPEERLQAIINHHFQVLDVNYDVALSAARLRASRESVNNIRTPDALIGATSIANDHTLFITNDERLADALPDDNCIYLKTAALELLEQRFPSPCVENDPIVPTRCGPTLPQGISLATLELGSVKPDPSAKWKRILADAFTVASVLNEPCVFFVLTRRNGRKAEAVEVLFWHDGLEERRPGERILKRLHEHIGYSSRTGKASEKRNRIHAFCFTSISRERARQSQPCYASKSNHQREGDAWKDYLGPLWRFRYALDLPQTTWLLCEDGEARFLKPAETLQFLEQAKNVLGWKE